MMASHSEAGLIARRHGAGSGVAGRLDHRAAAPVRNHARDNVMAMREKMRQLRGKNVIDNMKQPQLDFKLKQFSNVKSRLFELPRPTPNGKNLCERQSPCEEGIYPADAKEEEIDLATFERECERLKQQYAKKGGGTPRPFNKDSAGCPAYLQKIKANLAEKERQAEVQRQGPQIPAGYRQLPEDERKQTLEALQKKREDLEKAFRQLPLLIETAAQKRRQQIVLDKIKESDEAIKTFSNPQVLIEA